jgi:cytochrome c oxidase cbb3-type subunit 3
MPSWGGRIPEYQVWQLVAFIRSMNNQEPKAATPTRPDTIEQSPQTLQNKINGATR